MSSHCSNQTAAFEEFQRWKASMQGKNLGDDSNTTIIKSDVIDGVRGFTQDANLLPQNPEEEAAIIEQMKYQPKGLGKGSLFNRNYSYNALKDFTGKQRIMAQQMKQFEETGIEWNGPVNSPRPQGFCPNPTPAELYSANEKINFNGLASKGTKPPHVNNIATHLEMARAGMPEARANQRDRGGYQGGYGAYGHQAGEPYPSQKNTYSQQSQSKYPGATKEDRRLAFLSEWKKKKMEDREVNTEEKIVLRDPKAKLITFELISIHRFAVTQNFLMPEEIVQILKKYGGAYDFEQREWIVNLQKYKEVAIEISDYCRQKIIDLDPITQMAFDIIEYKIPFSDDSKKNLVGYDYRNDNLSGLKPTLRDLPPSLFHSLYNFQKVGVQYGIDNHGRCILGDEMGVGKTIQAISIAYLFQRDWPVLIVTPSSLKFSWRDELLTWIQHLRPDQIQVFAKSTEDFDPNCCIYIMSYVLATKLAAFIIKKNFKVCICDEAHYLKSRDSQRSRYLVPLLIKMKRIMLLSGTPILARPNELYNLVRILRPDCYYSFKEFGLRYCNPRESYFGIDWTGSSNMRELHLMLEKGLMIRRLKSEVLTELPAKRRQKIVVSTDMHAVRKINLMLKRVKNWDDKIQNTAQNSDGLLQCIADDFDGFVSNSDAQDETLNAIDDKYNHIINAYSLTGTAKVKGTIEFLDTLIENKMKFIVFAHHYEVMDAIEDSVVKKKISYIRIDGQIDPGKRYEAVRKFQNDPNCLIGILALTASSQGITLTAASTVVFAEMNWTPGIMVQAEDRCHRIGQNKSVNVYYCYGENTVDGMIYPRLKLKSEVFANILDGKQTEFNIENDEDVPCPQEQLSEEDQKRLEKEAKLIERTIVQDEANRLQQTNISDFFFGSGMSSSKASTQAGDTPVDPSETGMDYPEDDQQSKAAAAMEDDFVEYDENIEYDRPPTPPLASLNVFLEDAEQQDCGLENFDEGTDSKWKTYQNIRRHKKQFYYQQKELAKQKKSMSELQKQGLPDNSSEAQAYIAQQNYNQEQQTAQKAINDMKFSASVDEEHPLYKEQMEREKKFQSFQNPAANNQAVSYEQAMASYQNGLTNKTTYQNHQNPTVPHMPYNPTNQQNQQSIGAINGQSSQVDYANPDYPPQEQKPHLPSQQYQQPHQASQISYQSQSNHQQQNYPNNGASQPQPVQAGYQSQAQQAHSQYSNQSHQTGYNQSYNSQASNVTHGGNPSPYRSGNNPSVNPWEQRQVYHEAKSMQYMNQRRNNYFNKSRGRGGYQNNKFNNKYNDNGASSDQYNEFMEMQEEVLKVEEEFLERLPQENPEVVIRKTLNLLKTVDDEMEEEDGQVEQISQSNIGSQSEKGTEKQEGQKKQIEDFVKINKKKDQEEDGEESKSQQEKKAKEQHAKNKKFIRYLQKLIFKEEKVREESKKPILETEEAYAEEDYFPNGLPEVKDLDAKKRKTEEEKDMMDWQKNPQNSPLPKDSSEPILQLLQDEPQIDFQIGSQIIKMPVAFFRQHKQYEFIQRPITDDDKKLQSMAETAFDQLDNLDEDLGQVVDDAMTLQSEIDLQQLSQRQQNTQQAADMQGLQGFYNKSSQYSYNQPQQSQYSQSVTVSGCSNGIAVKNKWRPNNFNNPSQQSAQNGDCGQFFSQQKRKVDLQDHFGGGPRSSQPYNQNHQQYQPQQPVERKDPFAFFEAREESSALLQEKSELQAGLPPILDKTASDLMDNTTGDAASTLAGVTGSSIVNESQMSFASQQTGYNVSASQRTPSVVAQAKRSFQFLKKKKS